MNPKRVKLLLAAFVAALVLFSLLLKAPLPSPTSPLGRSPLAGQRSDAAIPERPVPGKRVAVTSLSREDPPVASPAGNAPGETSSVAEIEAAKVPPEPPEELAAVSTKAPPEHRAPEAPTAVASAPREVVPEETEPAVTDPAETEPVEPTKLAEVRSLPTPETSRLLPRTVEKPPERLRRDAPTRRASSRPPPRAAGRRVRTLDDEVSALEKLLATGEDAPVFPRHPSRSEKPETDLVAELERLFPSTTPARALSPASGAAPDDPQPDSPTTSLPPRAASRSVREWQARRQHYRALAREEDSARVSAVFRLEEQDPETFRAVMVQYRMDVLLEIPARGSYSIIPHGGDYWDRTEFRKGQEDLRIRYGLSVRDLSLPWLRALRETHVATKLVSTEAVDVALLVPKHETELLLGSIVAGCRSLGHTLGEVSACYGTFVERVLSGKRVYDYEVTRLILGDGTLVKARGT